MPRSGVGNGRAERHLGMRRGLIRVIEFHQYFPKRTFLKPQGFHL